MTDTNGSADNNGNSFIQDDEHAAVVKAMQKELANKINLLNVQMEDLAKKGQQINPGDILANRIEFLFNVLFPAHGPDDDPQQMPTNPQRLQIEAMWVDMLTEMHKQANRQALLNGAGNGLIVPNMMPPKDMKDMRGRG